MQIPAAVDLEERLLGAILLRPVQLGEVADVVQPGDFYRPAHGRLFEAMLTVGENADQAAFFDRVFAVAAERDRHLPDGGDRRQVALAMLDCLGACDESRFAVALAERVAELAQARRLMAAAAEAYNAVGTGAPVAGAAWQLQHAVQSVTTRLSGVDDPHPGEVDNLQARRAAHRAAHAA